jgi:hypothetical protein
MSSLNELRWEVIFVDIGGIVDHHSMSWSERWFVVILVELLTITQWVEVRGDCCWYTHWVIVNNSTNINKNHLSPQFIEWWSTIPPISTKITFRLNSLSDGQQFHQYQPKSWSERWCLLILVELLTITQWVEVRGDFCRYWWNCWPSLNSTNINKNHLSPKFIEWWSTIPPISTKITSHFNSLSDGQQCH